MPMEQPRGSSPEELAADPREPGRRPPAAAPNGWSVSPRDSSNPPSWCSTPPPRGRAAAAGPAAEAAARPAREGPEGRRRRHRGAAAGTPVTTVPPAKLTVGWLLDNRALGRRFSSWLAVLHATRKEPPWPGFPFTAEPGATPAAQSA